MASNLYCEDCVVNTRDSVCLIYGPDRSAPCAECLKRIHSLFLGPHRLVLQRLLNAGVIVHVEDGTFDITGFGQWVVGDVNVTRIDSDGARIEPPAEVIRSIMTIVAKCGTERLLQDLTHDFSERSWDRADSYPVDVAAKMKDQGAEVWGLYPEPEQERIAAQIDGLFARLGEKDPGIKVEAIEQFLQERGGDVSTIVADGMRRYAKKCRETEVVRA